MAATLKLKKIISQSDEPPIGAYQLTVQVTEAENITTKVFVNSGYLDADGILVSEFFAVCTPYELVNLPEALPSGTSALYRTDTATFISNSAAVLEEYWSTLQNDVISLCKDYDALDNNLTNKLFSVSAAGITEVS